MQFLQSGCVALGLCRASELQELFRVSFGLNTDQHHDAVCKSSPKNYQKIILILTDFCSFGVVYMWSYTLLFGVTRDNKRFLDLFRFQTANLIEAVIQIFKFSIMCTERLEDYTRCHQKDHRRKCVLHKALRGV